MEKLTYILEKGTEPRTFILHFNREVKTLLSHLARVEVLQMDKDAQHMMSRMGAFGPQKIYEPAPLLLGVENIVPTSRYAVVIRVAKAFRFDDVMASIENALEIDMSEDEQFSWEDTIVNSYPKEIARHMGALPPEKEDDLSEVGIKKLPLDHPLAQMLSSLMNESGDQDEEDEDLPF
jgi:hypothetical protein